MKRGFFMQTKYIFMTGGVCSGLGKGITAASLGRLLKARGYRVTIQKFDPYINMYPGMLNPEQHGEVFVTEDGAEVDLDLGHYERFIDENLYAGNSVSAGRIYGEVLSNERRGDYMGSTIQVIPHVTDVIKEHIRHAGGGTDIIISEIGGTVGDIESLPFLEAIRQIMYDEGAANVMYVHVTLVPYLAFADEMKTKPTQHAVKELLSLGIRPDAIVCRTEKPLTADLKKKLSDFCNVDKDNIIENANVDCIYEVPLLLEEERFADIVCKRLLLNPGEPELTEWAGLVAKYKAISKTVNIGMVCKYELPDAYLSVHEALRHAGIVHNVKINTRRINAEGINDGNAAGHFDGLDGIVIPSGYGGRGFEGQISAAKYARENKIPFLGIGQGMQSAIIEFARNVAGITGAGSAEDKGNTSVPVINHINPPAKDAETKPPMRKGAQPCVLNPESITYTAYGTGLVHERFRHLYKLYNLYREELTKHGLVEAATSPDNQFVEAVELPKGEHPWYVCVQFRPEFKSSITRPSPLFKAFLGATLRDL